MNWDALGAIAELLGAVAVLATLIYLAIQLRQNVLLGQATIRESRLANQTLLSIALAEAAEAMIRDEEGNATASEHFKVSMLRQAVFHDMDAYCKQYDMGLLEEDEWLKVKLLWASMMKNPRTRSAWDFYKKSHSETLNAVLSQIIKESGAGA